ncbi:MAG: glycosyltransferase [Elainellaceae cyanobacterium]
MVAIAVAGLALGIWGYLLVGRGQFWRTIPRLESVLLESNSIETESQSESEELQGSSRSLPSVQVIIPARNEAEVLPHSLPSLLNQDYGGNVSILLVDDHSTDDTAVTAQAIARRTTTPLEVLSAKSLPPGWTGKLWALQQGTAHALAAHIADRPDYLLLTDADIRHSPQSLRQLVTLAERRHLQMASVMVRLRCDSKWEQLLIPAFVFFFQKLYPFSWSNDPYRKTAAAAGGCVLLRPEALQRIGGIAAIRRSLIDDCALAAAVKHTQVNMPPFYPIWLGLSDRICSLRPYPTLKSIWDMVARTAYTQLRYSPLLLLGSVLGMALVYLVPPISLLVGLLSGQGWLALLGLLGWLAMSVAYWPMVRFYRCASGFAFALPAIALLYTLMTLDSAWRHIQGRGGAWKGRTYPSDASDSRDSKAMAKP